MKRILVISHSPFNHPYGASTSIREHYTAVGMEEIEFIHISRTKIYGKFSKDISNNNSLPKNTTLKCCYKTPLPDSANTIFYEKSKYLADKNKIIRDFLWTFKAKKIISQIVKFKPDLIHFNSLVLSKLFLPIKNLLPDTVLISHARELLLSNISKREKLRIQLLDRIVAIDISVKKRLNIAIPEFPDKNIQIIQNPFKSSSKKMDIELSKFFHKDEETVTFSIMGSISHIKGVALVCEAFDKINLPKTELIIFGAITNSYGEKLKKRWSGNSKITWAGHHEYLLARGVFNKVDCVIRGESSFCTGRTVYEILFSGGEVILPGSEIDMESDLNLNKFKSKVQLYKPRDISSLIESLNMVNNKLQQSKERPFKEISNYENYKKCILNIYNIHQ